MNWKANRKMLSNVTIAPKNANRFKLTRFTPFKLRHKSIEIFNIKDNKIECLILDDEDYNRVVLSSATIEVATYNRSSIKMQPYASLKYYRRDQKPVTRYNVYGTSTYGNVKIQCHDLKVETYSFVDMASYLMINNAVVFNKELKDARKFILKALKDRTKRYGNSFNYQGLNFEIIHFE